MWEASIHKIYTSLEMIEYQYQGVWKVSNQVNPSRLQRLERNERVRRAGWELYDSKLPKVPSS